MFCCNYLDTGQPYQKGVLFYCKIIESSRHPILFAFRTSYEPAPMYVHRSRWSRPDVWYGLWTAGLLLLPCSLMLETVLNFIVLFFMACEGGRGFLHRMHLSLVVRNDWFRSVRETFVYAGYEDHRQRPTRPADSDVLCHISTPDGISGTAHSHEADWGSGRRPQRCLLSRWAVRGWYCEHFTLNSSQYASALCNTAYSSALLKFI